MGTARRVSAEEMSPGDVTFKFMVVSKGVGVGERGRVKEGGEEEEEEEEEREYDSTACALSLALMVMPIYLLVRACRSRAKGEKVEPVMPAIREDRAGISIIREHIYINMRSSMFDITYT
ncbi:unnamed protein product [Cylicocyclus nassatus]|uniref:Uncharacterized protein n=1 Tax=Cylicocyclus nassatus TaxID=53992 RepID=A0AA36H6Z2_CYLNA|nr:unnamed protein product [Cylicocyclus nassatus]